MGAEHSLGGTLLSVLAVIVVVGLWLSCWKLYPRIQRWWLSSQVHRFQGLLNATEVPCVVLDEKGWIRARNRSSRSFFRQIFKHAKFQPQHMTDLLSAGDTSRAMDWLDDGTHKHQVVMVNGLEASLCIAPLSLLGVRFFHLKLMI